MNNEIILKSQQRFTSEAHNLYCSEINKIPLSSSDDKRLQTSDRITSYPYGTSAGKICKTELLSKYKLLILMIIPDHPYRILIVGASGSGKTSALFNLINNQPDIDKIYLYAKDPYESKY